MQTTLSSVFRWNARIATSAKPRLRLLRAPLNPHGNADEACDLRAFCGCSRRYLQQVRLREGVVQWRCIGADDNAHDDAHQRE